jgi:hypothetical protein
MAKKKMRTVMNPAMRGQLLALRYTRDRNGVSIQVQCDDRGCVEVPEEEAAFLLETPGWRTPPKKGRSPTSAPRRSPPKPSAAATVKDGPQNAPPPPKKAPAEPTEEDSAGADEEESGDEPSLDDVIELRTKAAATAYAKKFREAGYEVPELDQDSKLSEMKDVLVEALFDDDEEGDEGGEGEEE